MGVTRPGRPGRDWTLASGGLDAAVVFWQRSGRGSAVAASGVERGERGERKGKHCTRCFGCVEINVLWKKTRCRNKFWIFARGWRQELGPGVAISCSYKLYS